jgi:hypothetical protein
MTASHELVWVAALLDCLPQVEVLDVQVRSSVHVVEWYPSLPGVELRVHADGWEDAGLLVEALGLPEVEDTHGCDRYRWRTWRGWCAEGSREMPVCVEVTAGEVLAESAA